MPIPILHGKFKSDSFFHAYIFCMEILNLISFSCFSCMKTMWSNVTWFFLLSVFVVSLYIFKWDIPIFSLHFVGTPEMLSPVSMEAPTPPPQPSPGAFSPKSPAAYRYGNRQSEITPQHVQGYQASPGLERTMSPRYYDRMDNGHTPQYNGGESYQYSQRSRQSPGAGRGPLSPADRLMGHSPSANKQYVENNNDYYRNKNLDEDLALSRWVVKLCHIICHMSRMNHIIACSMCFSLCQKSCITIIDI